MDDDICICGFVFSDHPERTIEDRGNGAFRAMIGNAHPKTTCIKFIRRTNLTYLEQLSRDSDL